MSSSRHQTDPDRVFVRHGRRHYRRRYSATEVRLGIAILGLLALIVAWVGWQGANPDPELFASQADLLVGSAGIVDRGPLPETLAGPGWVEGPVSRFDPTNLYEKINGREGYYKGFGFEMLTFISLSRSENPTQSIDIEVFDLGSAPNAGGAYAGERPPDISPVLEDGGMFHFDRNALFISRGRYYIRVIGSDESETVLAQLEVIRTAFEGIGEAAEELPPAFTVFVTGLGFDQGQVSYLAENAFSFGFARDVYTVLLEDDETEMFLIATESEETAVELARRYNDGFEGYGTPLGGSGTINWVEDRYIGTLAGAHSSGSWVLGVRGAPDLAVAENALTRLGEAVSAYP